MLRAVLAIGAVTLMLAASAGSTATQRRVPGAAATKACAGAGAYWPTMTLALDRGLAWVACKEQSRVLRVDPRTGKTKQVRLDGFPIAVLSAFGSVWAIDSGSTLYRIDPGSARVVKRSSIGAGAAYNLWTGGGSLWTVDDNAGQVIRIAPSGRVLARLDVGDGPADMVFNGPNAYVVNHRDRALVRIALASNTLSRVATSRATHPSASRGPAASCGSPAAAPTCSRSTPRPGRSPRRSTSARAASTWSRCAASRPRRAR